MLRKFFIFVLLIIPTSILVAGCESPDSIANQAKDLQSKAAGVVAEVKNGVENVVTKVNETKDSILEKKRQLEKAIADIEQAKASLDTLLNGATPDQSDTENNTTTATPVDLQRQKAELEKTLQDAEATLNKINGALKQAEQK